MSITLEPDLEVAGRLSAPAAARAPRLGAGLLVAVPAGLTAWAAFHAGGYFPDGVGVLAAALAVALLLRVTLAARPFAGWSAAAAVATGAGALLATWTLASALWSDAPARALLEMHRVLLYVLAFALMATLPRRRGSLDALLRWVLLAFVATAVAALATRLLPGAFALEEGSQASRLAFPVTYWNTLAVLCALGSVLAVHLACTGGQPAPVRMLAGAALPVLATAGYFPFSRGGIATAAIGLVLYAILAHPRRLPFTLLSAGPPTAVALIAAYRADALATDAYARGAGPAQGHRLGLVLLAAIAGALVLRLVLLPLERRVAAIRIGTGRRRGLLLAGAAVAVLTVGAAAVSSDLPERAHAQYRAFVAGNIVHEGSDVRSRLTAAGNNGRIELWRVGIEAYRAEPVHGTGAGTYVLDWARLRAQRAHVVDAHSLYVEVLGELGVVGLGLLVVMLAAMLWGPLRALAGPERHAGAAVLAGGLALLVHAGIDWDWEMPVLFVWLFAATGVAAARPAGRERTPWAPGRLARVVAGLGCLLLLISPVLAVGSQTTLRRAGTAFDRNDCPAAIDAALSSLDALSVRPEPYEVVGYCDLRLGETRLAVRAMANARARDPHNWRYAYGLAVARALDGRDPRAAMAAARRLNPLDPEARSLARAFARAGRAGWPRAAARARLPTS